MICTPVRSIIPSLKLRDYLSVQVHKPCSISHLYLLFDCGKMLKIYHIITKRCKFVFMSNGHISIFPSGFTQFSKRKDLDEGLHCLCSSL